MDKKVTPVDASKAKPVTTAEAKQNKRDYAQKRFIVTMLAQHEPPSAVVAEVRENFGIELTRQMVSVYDPTKRSGRDLSKELRELFFEEREAYEETLRDVALSSKVVRMRLLTDGAFRFHEKGNFLAMAQLVEQAAKEVGDIFTNRREVSGPKGGDIEVAVKPKGFFSEEQYTKMTPEQRAKAKQSVLTLQELQQLVSLNGGERAE